MAIKTLVLYILEEDQTNSVAMSIHILHMESRDVPFPWRQARLGHDFYPVWQALAGHKRRIPLAVVLPRPARGAGTLILCPWDFPGESTGVGCHFLLQGIFPTQGWNPGESYILFSYPGAQQRARYTRDI